MEQGLEKRNSSVRRLAGGCALLLTACGGGPDDIRPIAEVREVELLLGDRPRPAAVADRFGFGGPTQPTASVPRVDYDLPAGWEELAPTQFRAVNLLAGDQHTECYLTLLPGGAGGLAANVNRWREQMSLEPLDDDALAALPRARLLGRDAAFLDIEGSFTVGDEIREGWRLVGLLAFDPSGAVFLKMTGPRDVVERELGRFHTLARSLRSADTPSAERAPQGGESPGGLSWELPPGWRRAADRPMRVANFLVGESEPVECYITVLGGDGGGALANVNRWRRQLGQEPIEHDGLDAFERLPMLDHEGLLVEIEGSMGDASAMMLGAICLKSDHAVFVKMTGPLGVVAPERDAFVSFCKSLTM